MNKQQYQHQNAKLKAQLAISEAEKDLAKAQYIHLNRLICYNERFDAVRPRVKKTLSIRLEQAEDMILEAKQALRKAQANYNKLMEVKV
ncbi:hypothetical protein [Marinifilum flexuosum]|uniref:hypothetical protein n=1 Tax=Marinifilum flexuosum TaxID=1117708 RepID=UPI002491C214|nr:hypothetical protein [Marinifilum flexuosum]